MRGYTLEPEQPIAHPPDQVFEFFAQARNLERIFEFRYAAVQRELG